MHRALCAVLGQLQPSGMKFWEWCLVKQSAPLLVLLPGPVVLVRMGSHQTPLIPCHHVGWVKGQQLCIAAKGEQVWGNSHSLQRGTKKKTPLY